jgi:hypothetical protein
MLVTRRVLARRYAATGGYLMVVDVQGVRLPSNRGFVLTDPAILCVDSTRFGRNNWSVRGIERMFQKHVCNSICAALSLDRHAAQVHADIIRDTVVRPDAAARRVHPAAGPL